MSAGSLSPDGKWLWTGAEWIPAPPVVSPEAIADVKDSIVEVAKSAGLDADFSVSQAANFDLNHDGKLQQNEIEASVQSILNPPNRFEQPPQQMSMPNVPGAIVYPAMTGLPQHDVFRTKSKDKKTGRIIVASLIMGCAIIVAVWFTSANLSPFPSVRDSDGDGYVDSEDIFPYSDSQWADSDNDGFGNNKWGQRGDDCPAQTGFSTRDLMGCPDLDRDGYSDLGDVFPNDSSEWEDTDADGVGNNADLVNNGDALLYFSNVVLTASSAESYDVGSPPDMYLTAQVDLDCDGDYENSKTSPTVWDDYSVTAENDIDVYIDIPEDTTVLCYRLFVYDEDSSEDDILDYNEDPDYPAKFWTASIYSSFEHRIEESSTDYKPVTIDVTVSVAYAPYD